MQIKTMLDGGAALRRIRQFNEGWPILSLIQMKSSSKDSLAPRWAWVLGLELLSEDRKVSVYLARLAPASPKYTAFSMLLA